MNKTLLTFLISTVVLSPSLAMRVISDDQPEEEQYRVTIRVHPEDITLSPRFNAMANAPAMTSPSSEENEGVPTTGRSSPTVNREPAETQDPDLREIPHWRDKKAKRGEKVSIKELKRIGKLHQDRDYSQVSDNEIRREILGHGHLNSDVLKEEGKNVGKSLSRTWKSIFK